jgi:hypothetical protein
MITRPTKFQNAHRVVGEVVNPIFCIYSSGSIVHAYSYTDMQFGSTHVYPLLDKIGTITESINISTRGFSTPRTTVQLKNVEHTIISGEMRKLSYVLGNTNVRGEECRVYLMAGQQVTDIETDCLCIFKGIILDNPAYTIERVYIDAISDFATNDIDLPNTAIGDVYSSTAPDTHLKRGIPIVYGKYDSIADASAFDPSASSGLAVAVRISQSSPPKYVVSDHECDALTNGELYLKDAGLELPCLATGGTVTLDDSDRTTYTPNPTFYAFGLLCDCREYDDDYTQLNYLPAYNDAIIDYEKAYDNSDSSYAQVRDNTDNGTKTTGFALYFINDVSWFMNRTRSSTTEPRPEETIDNLVVQYKIFDLISGGGDTRKIRFVNINGNAYMWAWAVSSSSSNRYNSASFHNILLDKDYDGLMFELVKNTDPDADSTANNRTIARLYDMRIRARFKALPADYGYLMPYNFTLGHPSYRPVPFKGSVLADNSFVACDGMAYGTWISSRSSSYSSGNCIEDPAGIIESILRDICGLATADIDLTSFIDAENTDVEARINFHDGNKMSVFDAIQQLSAQSTFSFACHANGKVSLIPLMPYSGSTTKVWTSHIDLKSFKPYKWDYIINEININSRWQQERGEYYDYQTIENFSSQSSTGVTGTFNAEWPNICGDSAVHVGRHMVKDTDGYDVNDDGIYAYKHNCVHFETKAATYAHLECGDWIEFESDTLDKQVLCYTSSWSGKKFLIVSKSHKDKSTAFEAIELF